MKDDLNILSQANNEFLLQLNLEMVLPLAIGEHTSCHHGAPAACGAEGLR